MQEIDDGVLPDDVYQAVQPDSACPHPRLLMLR
jgi:hypothetical protein